MAAQGQGEGVTKPARSAVAVNVSVSDVTLPEISKGIYIGDAGTIAVDMVGNGTAVSFTVVAGTLLPIQAKKILNAGTSVTTIVALY